jgi:AcrR family transcriptional regulator
MKRAAPVPDRLVDVAIELFTRRGYDAVSVREITSRAHANLGAITYHFGSKEALYHAAIERAAEPFARTIATAAASDGSALDRIEAVVRAALSSDEPRNSVPVVMLRELANDGPLPPPLVRLMERNIGTIASLIAEGQRDGSVRQGDPTMLALSVVAQPFYFKIAARGLSQAFGISRESSPGARKRVIEHVTRSVRHTIASAGALRAK